MTFIQDHSCMRNQSFCTHFRANFLIDLNLDLDDFFCFVEAHAKCIAIDIQRRELTF